MKNELMKHSIAMLALGAIGGGSCWNLVHHWTQDEVVTKQLIVSDGDGKSGVVLKLSKDGRYLCIASIDAAGQTSSHPLMTIGLDGSLFLARDDGAPLFGVKANREAAELMLGGPGEAAIRLRSRKETGLLELASGAATRAQMSVNGSTGDAHVTLNGTGGGASLSVDSDRGAGLSIADRKLRPLATVGAGRGAAGLSLFDHDGSDQRAPRAIIGFGSRRDGGAALEMQSGDGGTVELRADKSSTFELRQKEGGLVRWAADPDAAALSLRGPGEAQWSFDVNATGDGVRTTVKEGKSDGTVLDASFGDDVLWNVRSRAGATQTIRWPR